jgi:nitroreductase
MDAIECINSRRSIRAFLSKPVSRNLLEKVLTAAGRSPSYTNSQPWEVAAVAGSKCKELKKLLGDLAGSGIKTNPDFPFAVFPRPLAQRSLDHRIRRAHFMGTEFGTEEQARQNRLANYDFYGAPAVLFIMMDRTLGPYSMFDMGLFVQNLALAANAYGLGTCIQAMLAAYPDAVRKHLDLPDTKAVIVGVSIGYYDPDKLANQYVSTRVGIDNFVKWF